MLAFLQERLAVSQSEGLELEEEEPRSVEQREVAYEEQGRESPVDAKGDLSASSDLFVEVGDAVTFVPLNSPMEKRKVVITAGPSDPATDLVNEDTALAKALLGLSTGELAELQLPGQPDRTLKIVKISRYSADNMGVGRARDS